MKASNVLRFACPRCSLVQAASLDLPNRGRVPAHLNPCRRVSGGQRLEIFRVAQFLNVRSKDITLKTTLHYTYHTYPETLLLRSSSQRRCVRNPTIPLKQNSSIYRHNSVFPSFPSSGGSKHFLASPGGVLLGEGTSSSDPRKPAGDALPLVSVPTSAGSGAAANARCLVWHPDDEVLVPLAGWRGKGESPSVRASLLGIGRRSEKE